MTANVPRQQSKQDKDIDTVRDLVRAGIVGPSHRRWREMDQAARALGIRPEDAVYRVHDGCWSDPHDNLADEIREATIR